MEEFFTAFLKIGLPANVLVVHSELLVLESPLSHQSSNSCDQSGLHSFSHLY